MEDGQFYGTTVGLEDDTKVRDLKSASSEARSSAAIALLRKLKGFQLDEILVSIRISRKIRYN
jgi:hypothetical protein